MGLESEYANSLTLTVIPPATYTTAETNVPVMVRIGRSAGKYRDDTSDVFSKLGASYQKMAISLDDDVTECPIEVKDWDATRQLGILFVKIPALPTTGMTLKLWYDPTHADNANVGAVGSAAGQSVWSNGFAGVWHKPSGGLLLDSTANANHGTIYGATAVQGSLGMCLAFDGISNYVEVPHDASLQPDPLTVDVLCISPWSGTGVSMVVSKYGHTSTYPYWGLGYYTGPVCRMGVRDSTPTESDSRTPKSSDWQYIAGRVAENTVDISVDGSALVSSPRITANYSNERPVLIGKHIAYTLVSVGFASISSGARSPDWIALTNASLKDELIAFSAPGSESLSGTERMRLMPDGTLVADEFVEV